jgi:hypothetical protein
MDQRIWTAEELERMTPDEQDAIFDASVAQDLDDIPPDFLKRVRGRAEKRIQGDEIRRT